MNSPYVETFWKDFTIFLYNFPSLIYILTMFQQHGFFEKKLGKLMQNLSWDACS
jgi:hypothetical protein